MNTQVLISEHRIEERIVQLGQQLGHDYRSQELVCVCILKGAVLFFSDLVRNIPMDVAFEFLKVSSYGSGTESSGKVTIENIVQFNFRDKHVLLVEDIVDTGLTLVRLHEELMTLEPKTLRTCALLSKPARRKVDVNVDYIGFEIEDKFVIGYGMDTDEKYRNLRDLRYIPSES